MIRLKVRTVMGLVLVVGAVLGGLVQRARVQRDAVAVIERAGGSVYYDWQVVDLVPDESARPPAPQWLVKLIGVDYFGSPTCVFFREDTGTCRDEHMASVGRLRRLERLDLSNCPITDAGLIHLKGLTRLRCLDLHGTEISDRGFVHLRGLTNLERLYLQSTDIGDSTLAQLQGMSKLRSLNLRRTQVTDKGMPHLKGLTRLEMLVLEDTQITDAGLAHLETLTNLTRLALGRITTHYPWAPPSDDPTREERLGKRMADSHVRDRYGRGITDEGIRHLKRLPGLRKLELTRMRITDDVVRELQHELPALKVLR